MTITTKMHNEKMIDIALHIINSKKELDIKDLELLRSAIKRIIV